MRILMVTDFYWPFLGGVEQHVRTLSTTLVSRGHQVTVATLWHDDLPLTEIDQGVRIVRIRSSSQRLRWLFANPGRPWAPPIPDPAVVWQLMRLIRRERPHVVHGHDWLARSFVPLKAWSGAIFIMSLHYYTRSCATKLLMYQGKPCTGPGLAKCLACTARHYGVAKGATVTSGNWLMSAAEQMAVDMFLPVSHATATGNGLATVRANVDVVPNFVADQGSDPTADIESYVSHLPSGGFLLFVGDMRRDKGIDVLLEAYSGIDDAPPLVLIGKVWPDTPSTLPSNVMMLTNWPNHAVRVAWSRSIVGLVPSIWPEPFGIVVIEAMASGRPVIASRIGGIPDIIRDGETGLLVAPGDAAELRAAIQRLISNAELRDKLGRAAQLQAERYRADYVVPHIEQIYARLVGPRINTTFASHDL